MRNALRTVFVIVSTCGIFSTAVVFAAPQIAVSETPVGLTGIAEDGARAVATTGAPEVSAFYTSVSDDAAGLRVSFVQKGDLLTSTWMDSEGDAYGRGSYRWDNASKSFKGTSTSRYVCLGDDPSGTTATSVIVREELLFGTDGELRDRWTKPLNVDCTVGLVEVFKWAEQKWVATDKYWKPLSPLQPPVNTTVSLTGR